MGSSIMLIVRSGLTKPAKKAMLFLFRPELAAQFPVFNLSFGVMI